MAAKLGASSVVAVEVRFHAESTVGGCWELRFLCRVVGFGVSVFGL